MQRVEGEVQQVQCSACAASFPTFLFSGDTDMAAFGLEAISSVEPPFVVLGRLTEDELRAGYPRGRQRFADRMSQLLGSRLVALSVARWVQEPSGEGLAFQQFRQAYLPSKPIYFCPSCGAEAAIIMRQSPADFVAQGGRLELAGDLILAAR